MHSYAPLIGLLALATKATAADFDCDGDITIETSNEVESLRRSCTELNGSVKFNISDSDATLVYNWKHASQVDINGKYLSVLLGASGTESIHIDSLTIGPNVTKLALGSSVEQLTITEFNIEGGEEGDDDSCDEVTSTLEDSGMEHDTIGCTGKPDFVLNWQGDLEGADHENHSSDNPGSDEIDDDGTEGDSDENTEDNSEESSEGDDVEDGAVGVRTARVGVAMSVTALTFLALLG